MAYLCTSVPYVARGVPTAMASTFGQVGSVAGIVPRIGRNAPHDEAGVRFLDIPEIEMRRSQPCRKKQAKRSRRTSQSPSSAALPQLVETLSSAFQDGPAVLPDPVQRRLWLFKLFEIDVKVISLLAQFRDRMGSKPLPFGVLPANVKLVAVDAG
jgi:hypothetical protein